jgi:Tol biopolymer transport system component
MCWSALRRFIDGSSGAIDRRELSRQEENLTVCRQVATLGFGTLIALLGIAPPVAAQYFGRNKVQYEEFDFRILETPHFSIYYYPAEHDAVVEAGRLAERWYARLSSTLDHEFRERQVIILYASHAHFTQTNVIPGFVSEGVGGVTDVQKGRIVLPFAAGLSESDHVLGHELVHAFQRDILRQRGRSLSSLPLWFVEGMAEYLSIGRIDSHTAMWLRDGVEHDRLPRIDQLDDPQWFPYRYGQALWAYLAIRHGEDVMSRALVSKASGGAIGRLAAVTGSDARVLSDGWHEWIRQSWGVASSSKGGDRSKVVIAANESSGRLNVGPALSPDGTGLVFLSERDQYSIDVFLANAETGAIIRRLVRTAGDPHFDSLQFIESAGAWDPAGRRFVLAAVYRGEPVLTVLDMQSGVVEREIRLDQLDQIFSPTWSPDGRRLAFSALNGGMSDLYILDLETGALRRLTSDAFADLQPAWSPDEGTIVFSTDRFSSSLTTLSFGNYRLGTIDVRSGAIREVPSLPDGKNIDPKWSADGKSVYFVADNAGVSNVYRVVHATGELFQITDVRTGVSGVTALSPALSVGAHADRLVFSVYRQGAYEIRTIEAPRGTPLPPAQTAPPGGPPLARTDPSAANGSGTGILGRDFTVKPSRRSLSLNGIGQPYLSAGGGSFGGFLRAGVSFSFGDTLGDQQLHTALQVGKGIDDFAAQTAYVNLRSRWNWGVVGGQIPWRVGASKRLLPGRISGETTIARELVLLRQVHRQLSGFANYPFSRTTRLELSAGVHGISFARRTTTGVYSSATGRLLDETTDLRAAAVPVRLIETSAALVHDTSVPGPTSPVLGERYRFAIEPTLGDLTLATVIADYRKYMMPVRPFTIAIRIQHVGRYGADGGDPRLLPLVPTLRDVVRGYGDTLAVTRGCGDAAATECTPMSYLSARSLLVGNIELRFPPLGAFRRSATYGPLPLEAFLFSDAGLVWSRAPVEHAAILSTPLRSVGAGVRLNAGGFLFEFDLVRPFDRPSSGWRFAFNVRPGF